MQTSRQSKAPRNLKIFGFFLCLCFGITGCDDDTLISPFSGRDAHFSVYGYISHEDTHYVRVVPIRNTVDRSTEPTQASFSVRSTSVDRNTTTDWQEVLPLLDSGDRGLMFSDSTFGHVFRAVFTPFTGDSYTLEIASPDGDVTTARISAPPVTQPVVDNIWTRNDSTFQTIILPGISESPLEMKAGYRLASPLFYPDIQHPLVFIDYTGKGYATDAGWRVDMDLASDVVEVRQFVADNISSYSPYSTVEDPATMVLVSVDMRFRIVKADSMWSRLQNNPVILSTLSQPGAFSNVTNGFGYVGATGTNVVHWMLPTDSTRIQIGFDG